MTTTHTTTPDQGDERRATECDLVTVGAMHKCMSDSLVSECVKCGAFAEGLSRPCKKWMDDAEQVRAAIAEQPADQPVAQEASELAEQCKELADEMAWAHGDHRAQCHQRNRDAAEQTCNASNEKRREFREAVDRLASLAAPQPSQGARGSNPNSLRSIEAGQLAWDSLADVRQRGVGDV